MSIIAYCGLPGSGKSYSVVKHQILPALKLGRKVVTNIPLKLDAIRADVKGGEVVELPIDNILQEPHLIDEYATPGCVLVLDELWRLFPAGEKVNNVPESFKSLLAEHRHRVDEKNRSMQIVFVTQSVMQIGAFARQLVEQTLITTKLTDVGLSTRYRVDVYRQAVAVEKANPQNAIRSIQARKYEPRIFEYYQSHTMAEKDPEEVDEGAMDTRGSFLKRPLFIVGPIFIAAVMIFAVPFLWGLITGERSLVADESQLTASAPAGTPLTSPGSVVSSAVRVSPARAAHEYRVVGWILNSVDDLQDGIALVSDRGQIMRVALGHCMFTLPDELTCRYKGEQIDRAGVVRDNPLL